MTLSEQIDTMRQRVMDTHAHDLEVVEALGRFMQQKDVDLMQALQAVVAADERRRGDIAQVIYKLGTRIGTLPLLSATPIAGNDMPRIARPVEAAYVPPQPPKLGAARVA